MKTPYIYKAKIKSVYDGDTVRIDWDLGRETWILNEPIRIMGIDTPEKRGDQKEAGKLVADYAKKMLVGKNVIIKTYKPDKYGRYLADIDIGGKDFGKHMIKKGFAKKYTGGKKSEWKKSELNKIIKKLKK